MLAGAGVAEERREGRVRLVLLGVETAVRLDAVLQAVQLPACISDLHASLTHVDRNYFALQKKYKYITSINAK